MNGETMTDEEHLTTRYVSASELAQSGATVLHDGRRWDVLDEAEVSVVLMERPNEIRVRFEYDQYAEWDWLEQEHEYDHWQHSEDTRDGIKYGDYGPIDAEGNEHIMVGFVVERHYEDGTTETLDALWGCDVLADDRSLVGVVGVDRAFARDDLDGFLQDAPKDSGLYYLASEALASVKAGGR